MKLQPRVAVVGAGLAGANAERGVDGEHPNLPVADLFGPGRVHESVDDALGVVVVNEDLEPHFGHEVDRVLRASVDLRVPTLAPEALVQATVASAEASSSHR